MGQLHASDFECAVRSHLAHFAELVKTQGPVLFGSGRPDGGQGQLSALRAISVERDNVLAAAEKAQALNATEALHAFADHLYLYLDMSGGSRTARPLYERLLMHAEFSADARLKLLAQIGLLKILWRMADAFDSVREVGREALALARELADRQSEARVLNYLAIAIGRAGDGKACWDLQHQALAIQREIGDLAGESGSLNNIGVIEPDQGRSIELLNQALRINRRIGNRQWEAYNLSNLGERLSDSGDELEGRRLLLESIEILSAIGDVGSVSTSLKSLGRSWYRSGDYAMAIGYQLKGLTLANEAGDSLIRGQLLSGLAASHCAVGDLETAAALISESLAELSAIGSKTSLADAMQLAAAVLALAGDIRSAAVVHNGILEQTKLEGVSVNSAPDPILSQIPGLLELALEDGQLSSADLDQLTTEGKAMDLEQLVEIALSALKSL